MPLILILSLITGYTFGQKLIVKNHKGKTKKIKIGKIMSVVSVNDSTSSPDPFHYYYDGSIGYYCPDGCLRLISIDIKNNSFKLKNEAGTLEREYKVDEVKSISYVQVKHPHNVFAFGMGSFVVGLLLIIQAPIDDTGSREEDMATIAIGTACIGASVILLNLKSPSTYSLVGVEE